MHAYIHLCTHTEYIHIYATFIHTYIYIHAYMHAYILIYIYIYIHNRTSTLMDPYPFKYAYIHTYIHIYLHFCLTHFSFSDPCVCMSRWFFGILAHIDQAAKEEKCYCFGSKILFGRRQQSNLQLFVESIFHTEVYFCTFPLSFLKRIYLLILKLYVHF